MLLCVFPCRLVPEKAGPGRKPRRGLTIARQSCLRSQSRKRPLVINDFSRSSSKWRKVGVDVAIKQHQEIPKRPIPSGLYSPILLPIQARSASECISCIACDKSNTSPKRQRAHRFPILVRTVPLGMPFPTLCVVGIGTRTRERPGRHSQPEHENEMNSSVRFGLGQWPGGVWREAPQKETFCCQPLDPTPRLDILY